MGISLQKPVSKITRFLTDYTVIQFLPSYHLTFLEHTSANGKQELLLKQYQFPTHTDAYEFSLTLEEKSHLYKQCPYLINLQKYLITDNEESGREGNSVYALYNFSHRTLDHERLERMMKDIRFGQNEVWSIAMSCVSALSFLQNAGVRHLNLSSSNITLDDEGVIKLYDPELIKTNPNYSQIASKQNPKNTYICPELCQNLIIKRKHPEINPYLSDVFVMGLIVLEIGLMEYLNDCYSDNYESFHYQVLQEKIERFGELYSDDLTSIVREMVKPIHLRGSFRRIVYLIRKFEPPESKYSSYRELEKPFETPRRPGEREVSRGQIEVESNVREKADRSEQGVQVPVIKGVTFANSDIKENKGRKGIEIMKDLNFGNERN